MLCEYERQLPVCNDHPDPAEFLVRPHGGGSPCCTPRARGDMTVFRFPRRGSSTVSSLVGFSLRTFTSCFTSQARRTTPVHLGIRRDHLSPRSHRLSQR